jgi:pimeloyl-ACP methyl ester carboxylesterase
MNAEGLRRFAVRADRVRQQGSDHSPHQARYFLDRIPDRLVELPGLGHVPMSDDPELVARTILDFSAHSPDRPASPGAP